MPLHLLKVPSAKRNGKQVPGIVNKIEPDKPVFEQHCFTYCVIIGNVALIGGFSTFKETYDVTLHEQFGVTEFSGLKFKRIEVFQLL